jgi:O-antigen/teichoic acid export membrane protein
MIAGGALALVAAQVGGLASLGVASIVIGRALGADGYGVFIVAFNFQTLLAVFACIGLGSGVSYEIGSGRWPAGPALRHAVAASLGLGLLGGIAGLCIVLAAGDDLLPGVSTGAVVALLATVPAALSVFVLVGPASALERYEALGLIQLGPSLGAAAIGSGLALVAGESAAVAGIGIGVGIAGLLATVWALRVAGTFGPSGRKRLPMGDAVRFGARTWVSDVLVLLNLRVDLLLVGAFAGSREAGLYGVAATLMTLGLVVPHAISWVLLPRVASLASGSSGDDGDPVQMIGRASRHATLLSLAIVPLLVLAVLLVPDVYGDSFQGTVKLGLVLVPGIAALGVSRVLSYSLAGFGRPGTVLRMSAAVVIPTVVAYAVLIPSTGALGAAVISTVSYTATLLLLAVATQRATSTRPAELFLPRRDDLRAYPAAASALRSYLRSARDRESWR